MLEQYAHPLDIPITVPKVASEYMQIYDEFIHPGSDNEINVSHKTRNSICKQVKEGVFICKSFHS